MERTTPAFGQTQRRQTMGASAEAGFFVALLPLAAIGACRIGQNILFSAFFFEIRYCDKPMNAL